MLKPPRTILALAAGSLVLGLVGAAGTAVADDGGQAAATPSQEIVAGSGNERADGYDDYDNDSGNGNGYDDYKYKHAIGKVVSKGPLKVRSQPTTDSQVVNQVYPNRKVEIECKTYGESVDGNRIWYRLHKKYGANPNSKSYGKKHWVSARYVKNLTEVKYCR
ncbi:SH3 domain-containing protein [Streptomyces sp. NPDC057011]|uniref:SH3 domain-containing protein n=1 Tax=unclassified Streptomyces TaxID=2593676 RepID=UPI0036351BA7